MLRLLSLLGLTSMLFITGCASYTQVQSNLRGFVGKDIDIALAQLGSPDKTIKRETHSIYIWTTGDSWNFQDTFNNQGPPTGRGSDVEDDAVFGQTPALGCAIKLTTNSENIIKNWEFDRGLSTCKDFRNKLETQ